MSIPTQVEEVRPMAVDSSHVAMPVEGIVVALEAVPMDMVGVTMATVGVVTVMVDFAHAIVVLSAVKLTIHIVFHRVMAKAGPPM